MFGLFGDWGVTAWLCAAFEREPGILMGLVGPGLLMSVLKIAAAGFLLFVLFGTLQQFPAGLALSLIILCVQALRLRPGDFDLRPNASTTNNSNSTAGGAANPVTRVHDATVSEVRAGGSIGALQVCARTFGCVMADGRNHDSGSGNNNDGKATLAWQLQPGHCIVQVESWRRGDAAVGVRFTSTDNSSFFYGDTTAQDNGPPRAPTGQCLILAEFTDAMTFAHASGARMAKHVRAIWE